MAGFEPPGPGQPPEEQPPGSPPPPSWPPRYPVYGGPQGGDPSSALKEAEHTRKLAGWALGLSFVFCMPLAALTSIGLAITALVQGSRARRVGGPVHNYGTGMAIAALPIAVVSLAIGAVLIVLGAIDDLNEDDDEAVSDSSSEGDAGDDVLPSKLREGDCFNEPRIDGLGPTDQFEATTVEVVLCKVPHDAEVFHAFQMPDGDFPGEDAINRRSLTCAKEFKRFVGQPYTRSDLDFIYYFPTEDSWNILDDRGITCSIFDPQGKVSGTLARSRR